MRIIRSADWRAEPWKNGGGITHEIARWPAGADDFDVRVSLAEVSRSGPFSRFAGYRRWSVLAGDAPIELVTRDTTHRLVALGDRIELPGDVAIDATLTAGPTHLFNVLARISILVGHGATPRPVRLAFALTATADFARWDAMIDPPRAPPETIWLAFSNPE